MARTKSHDTCARMQASPVGKVGRSNCRNHWIRASSIRRKYITLFRCAIASMSPQRKGTSSAKSFMTRKTSGKGVLGDRQPVVGRQHGAVDELRLVGDEQQQRAVEVLGAADALARQHLHQLLSGLGVPVRVVDLGADIA